VESAYEARRQQHGRALASIVGIRPKTAYIGLSPVEQKLIASAELVVGGKRHLGPGEGMIAGPPARLASRIDAPGAA